MKGKCITNKETWNWKKYGWLKERIKKNWIGFCWTWLLGEKWWDEGFEERQGGSSNLPYQRETEILSPEPGILLGLYTDQHLPP